MITPVTASPRRRRTYDARLKLLVIEGGAAVARELGVPKSTASDWARNPPPDVASADVIALPDQELRRKVETLQRKVKLLVAMVVLLRALVAVSRFRLERSRITDPVFKIALLGAVERAVKAMPQRAGKVFASPATWCRYVRDRGWRRPRVRMHPSKPTEGVRSDKPDQLWHVDTTVLRLVDGRRVYLRAIIDNFSRKVLAWWAGANFDAGANAILLAKAAEAKNRPGGDFFLNNLDSLAAVVRLVEFYVTQHNCVLPHAALCGRTPDEVYFGTATEVADQLKEARAKAREARIEANRTRSCQECRSGCSVARPAAANG